MGRIDFRKELVETCKYIIMYFFKTSVPSSKSSGDLVDLFDATSQSTAGNLPYFFKNLDFNHFLKCHIKNAMKCVCTYIYICIYIHYN